MVRYKRQRQGVTDYKARLGLLKSGKPRLVVRKSANSITCQIISAGPKGDVTLNTASSFDLTKYGYKVHKGNIPAAYLTGYLCGVKAKKKKIVEAVFDIGLYRSTKGSVIYAALKGAVDSGLKIPHDPKNFPDENRTKGKHIEEYSKKINKPVAVVQMFEDAKKRINGEA